MNTTRRHSNRTDQSGFTIIELMVVVMILGILIAVALPVFLGSRQRAEDRQAQTDLRTAVAAAKVWFTDDASYTGFTGGAGGTAREIEPNIPWIGAVDPGPTDAVAITMANAGNLLIIRQSTSGRYFCLSDQLNVPGFSRGNGPSFASVDTQAECANGW